MSGFKRPEKPLLRAREKPTTEDQIAAIDAAGEEMGFTVRADPATSKPKRGAPARVTRKNPRRVSIELDGDDFKRLQLLGIERAEKLQSMCEQAVLDYLRKHENESMGGNYSPK